MVQLRIQVDDGALRVYRRVAGWHTEDGRHEGQEQHLLRLTLQTPPQNHRHLKTILRLGSKSCVLQVYRLQADAPRGFYRLPKRVDVGEVNVSCDLQGMRPLITTEIWL